MFFFALSPPNNAYDDHMSAIGRYASQGERPAPDACWQCYQPPAYYLLASGVLRAAAAVRDDNVAAWRAVQLLSVLFSCGVLALAWRSLALAGSEQPWARLCALSVLVFLPREVYASVFISNDALLGLAVAACVWLHLELRARGGPEAKGWLAALLAAVVLAAWTKQHGLIAVALPAAFFVGRRRPTRPWPWAILAAGLVLAALQPVEAWWRSGHWLVSNQHYFDWPSVQRPGSVEAASFLDLRWLALLREPTLGPATIDSFWTQLFAKLWFDYDPKFLVDTAGSRRLAAAWYGAGLLTSGVWAVGVVVALRRWRSWPLAALGALQAAFVLVPLLQTLRYPYFSSMKATFFLPALPVSALLLSFGFERLGSHPASRGACVALCVTLAGLFAWECVLVQEQIIDALYASYQGSKLWGFPPGWGTR